MIPFHTYREHFWMAELAIELSAKSKWRINELEKLFEIIFSKGLISIVILAERPGFAQDINSSPWTISYVNYVFFDWKLLRDIYQSSRIWCISRGYLTFPRKLQNISNFCFGTQTLLSACFIRWKKVFVNVFKNEIKRAYKYIWSPWHLLYLAGLFDFSSKTTKVILVLFALKFF